MDTEFRNLEWEISVLHACMSFCLIFLDQTAYYFITLP